MGAEPPVYRIVGNDISLTFRALENAVIEEPSETSTKSASLEVDESNSLDNLLEQRIISEIKVEPSISQTRLAEITGTSVRTIKREIKKLVDSGHIERTEGKRYGKWIVLKQFSISSRKNQIFLILFILFFSKEFNCREISGTLAGTFVVL